MNRNTQGLTVEHALQSKLLSADNKEKESYIRSDSFTHISTTQWGEWDMRMEQTDEIPSVIYPLYSCANTHTHAVYTV